MTAAKRPQKPWIDQPRLPRSIVEVGTLEWAKVMNFRLRSVWENRQHFLETWESEWAEVEEGRMWAIWPPDKPYGSPKALLKGVLGVTPEDVKSRLAKNGGDRKSDEFKAQRATLSKHGGARNQPCDARLKYGTDWYWLARLERDAPTDPQAAALLERVQAGEIRPHRAAVEMGWRRQPSALERLLAAWERASDEDRHALRDAIGCRCCELLDEAGA